MTTSSWPPGSGSLISATMNSPAGRRDEDNLGRARDPAPGIRRVRDGGHGHRPGGTAEMADVRARRRRPDRGGTGRADPGRWPPRPCAPSSGVSDRRTPRVLLFDGGSAPLAVFGPKLSKKADKALQALSRGRAVAGPLRVGGFLGWWIWLFIHIAFLTGYRNRLGALLTWWLAFSRDIRRERTFTTQEIETLRDIYAGPPAPGLPSAPAVDGPGPGPGGSS